MKNRTNWDRLDPEELCSWNLLQNLLLKVLSTCVKIRCLYLIFVAYISQLSLYLIIFYLYLAFSSLYLIIFFKSHNYVFTSYIYIFYILYVSVSYLLFISRSYEFIYLVCFCLFLTIMSLYQKVLFISHNSDFFSLFFMAEQKKNWIVRQILNHNKRVSKS